MKEGDLVCILFGGSVPSILRSADEQYQLVGEYYVDGLMRGEGVKKKKSLKRVLELC